MPHGSDKISVKAASLSYPPGASLGSGVQLLTDNTVPSADRWALISEHPGVRLVALVVFGADAPAWSPVSVLLPHPPNRYLIFCLSFHYNAPFRPTRSKIHQASCSGLCGEGILHENRAGDRQKVGEAPWECCGDPVIPGGPWPLSPCGAMDPAWLS